ncbi:AAA family ATPase [Roseovarius sp. SYSU LYC5161]|uniref:AAA family ATPase n=1 Tax=Roseovarius halophilus (ex Wu et al. 2025) TaxID=3376060 RepID=UPI003999AF15
MTRFIPVEEINQPLTISIGLSGGSGTGKTYSALRLARGIAKEKGGEKARIGFVDTENRRALHYRGEFPEIAHFDMQATDENGASLGYGPERWIKVIDAAEQAGLPVVVIDSFSHAWEGVGGILDIHSETLNDLTGDDQDKADRMNMLAWAKVKPRWKRLVDRIVRANVDLILCTRATAVPQKWSREKRREVNAFKTKTRREDVPWNPKIDADLMFEMTAMMVLDPSAPGCPVFPIKEPDQIKGLFDTSRPMDEETGRLLAKWSLTQGGAANRKAVLDAARDAARGGKQALQNHYKGLPDHEKKVVMADLDAIKGIAIEADARAAETQDGNLFTDESSETDRERAMEGARRAAEAEAQAHVGNRGDDS